MARLITNVKCDIYDINKLIFHKENLFILLKEIKSKTNIENRKNIDFWFEKNIQIQLSNIYKCVMSIEEQKYKEFYLVCFSNCVKKVSFADSRISVPVKLNPERYPESSQERLKYQNKIDELKTIDVVNKFFDIVNQNIKRVVKQKMFNDNMKANIVSNDSRNLSNLKDETIDLVLTSPPYAGAQKYIRAYSLNLYWLGYNNLKVLDNENIGRENYRKDEYKNLLVTGINDADILLQKIYKINPLRAHIASNYLVEMKNAFIESIRVLKKNKFLILVSSNNMVCGYEFKTQKFFKKNIGPSVFCISLSLNQKKNNESLNYYSFNYYFQRNYYDGRRNAIEYLKILKKPSEKSEGFFYYRKNKMTNNVNIIIISIIIHFSG